MRKHLFFLIGVLVAVTACEKHDPILPGERTAIFAGNKNKILGTDVPNLADNLPDAPATPCPYTQDASNVIRDGDKKIFSGFPTNNSVDVKLTPACAGGFVYAGLSTGEVVKINPRTRGVAWIADVFRQSNMTGGASMVDIIAPVVVHGKYVYAGGLGDAFCKINASTGVAAWCDEIGVAVPFIVMDNVSFVVGTDDHAYAIRNSDGAIYWRTAIKKQVAPTYRDRTLTVASVEINAQTGEIN